MQVLFATKNIIHTSVREVGDCEWIHASWIYGTPYRAEKWEFWSWLSSVLNPIEGPWFFGGDMNEIMWEFEKHGGCDDFHTRPRFLQEFMTNMELLDLEFCGPKYNWRGTRNNGLVQERLDRGLVNGSCQVRWHSTTVNHIAL